MRLLYPQLILLDDVVAILGGRHTAEALHHQDVSRSERVIEHTLLGVQVDDLVLRVGFQYSHHTREDHVVVLPSELRNHKLIDPHLTTHVDVIDLQPPLGLRHIRRIDALIGSQVPANTIRESGDELG